MFFLALIFYLVAHVFFTLLVLVCGDFYTLSNNIYYVGVVPLVNTLFTQYMMQLCICHI